MTATIAELIIRLQDEATTQAGNVSRALADIAKQEGAIGTQSAEMAKLVQQLNAAQAAAAKADIFATARKKLTETRNAFNAAKAEVERQAQAIAAAGDDATRQMQNALNRARSMVKDAASAYTDAASKAKAAYAEIGGSMESAIGIQGRLRAAVVETTEAITKQAAAEKEAAAAQAEVLRQTTLRNGRSRLARQTAGVLGMAGSIYVGHKANELVRATGETYKEFDDTRRYQAAILGLTPEQQQPFVDQAIHMGATTRFNDLQVLHAQTDLAQRGVKTEFIRPFVEQAAGYAGAMGTDLPDAVKTLEGIIFGTGKHIEDAGEAMATMKRVVDQSVKLAKIGGLDDEDIKQFFKFGAMPGSSAGLSDETLGAVAALMRRANIRGDEAGVAVRTMAAKLVSPTNKGLSALDSMGINYNDFAKAGPMDANNVARAFERNFGKKLTPEGMAALQSAISDNDVTGDQESFIAAFSEAALGSFEKTKAGKVRASDANKVAKFASTFWKNSVESIDSEGLFRAIMQADPTLAQLNAFFTDRQGARIGASMKDPALFYDYRNKLATAPENFANTISGERQGGFSGAVDRLEGSMKNLETAIGRAWDANGQGGVLTGAANLAGQTIQHIAELDPNIIAFGSAIGIAGSKVAEFTAAWGLVNTLLEFKSATALSASAASLEGAAAALTRAAGVQAGGAGGAGAAAGAGAGGFMAWASRALAVGGAVLGLEGIANLTTPDEDKRLADAAGASQRARGQFGDATLRAARSRYQPWWKIRSIDSEDGDDPQYIDKYLNEMSIKRYGGPKPARVEVDSSSADSVKQTLDALDAATVAPKIDTTSIDDAEVKVNRLASTLRNLSAMSLSIRAPSVDQTIRGIHADPGIGRAR